MLLLVNILFYVPYNNDKHANMNVKMTSENNYSGASNLIITVHAPKSRLAEIVTHKTGQ